MNILEKQLTVNNRKGVHGRIAAELIKIADRHKVRIYIKHDGDIYDCSSVLDILSIALVYGTSFWIKIEGTESEKAMDAIEKAISCRNES